MSILHTISKPGILSACRPLITAGDCLLFLEDGVYDLLTEQLPEKVCITAIYDDVQLRGLTDRLPPAVRCIDYSAYVSLICKYDRLINWN